MNSAKSDTKLLENVGENFIVSLLLDAGILVAKPFFDRDGTDLVGFTSVDNQGHFCRIQCKYRALKRTSSVEIDARYIVGAFVLFLYLKRGPQKSVYCFLPADIRRVFKKSARATRHVFRLSISSRSVTFLEEDNALRVTPEKMRAMHKLMLTSSPDKEYMRMAGDIVRRTKELLKIQKEHSELQDLIHELEIVTIEKKASEDLVRVTTEYVEFMKEHLPEELRRQLKAETGKDKAPPKARTRRS